MRLRAIFVAFVGATLLSGCAVNYSIQPDAAADQTIRYSQGAATILSDKQQGSIQITPFGVTGNRMVFGVAVFNKGTRAANYGVENVTSIDTNKTALRVYTHDELVAEAKDQARARVIAAILVGAAAAYAANQNAYSTTNGYVAGPGGFATFSATTYNPAAAAIGTAAAGAATGYAISSIENNLDDTMAHLNGALLQTTTVDPGRSYGGQVVVDLPKAKDWPQNVSLQTNWNGEGYSFDFTIAKVK